MPRSLRLLLLSLSTFALAGCPGETTVDDDDDDSAQQGLSWCEEELELTPRELNRDGPFGTLRNALAEDFRVQLLDGSEWRLSEQWTGCEVYLFLPDTLRRSGLDDSSLWLSDVDELIERSPRNAHYFFYTARDEGSAATTRQEMQERIEAALDELDSADADWWRARLHVVDEHVTEMRGWLDNMGQNLGRGGFGIDRMQKLRLFGNFADVTRFSNELSAAEQWPWEANLAYAAHEARYWNYEAVREEWLTSHEPTIVVPWEGEVLAEVVETEVELPSAAEMEGFDTFEIDLWMDCPDPNRGEFGYCGAWDYLSHLWVVDEDGETRIELARFITTYHREGRYLVDASHALPELAAGGTRRLVFSISPSWNPQAYLTRMHFRFSNQGKAARPEEAHPLWTGRNFNSAYNDERTPIDVPIPADATKVELVAIITGHGADTSQCAEFCNHQHEFTIGDSVYLEEHPTVGIQEGCVDAIDNGMVPNQGGTWWFGRGGWCPGQQVEPTVFDVTGDVTPGETATISYRGLLNGVTPPDNAGNIVLSSWLVISR